MTFKTRLVQGGKLAAIVVPMVATFEGVRTYAYRDPVGIPTACFGETKNIRMGMKFTMDECKAMLSESLIEHEKLMVRCIQPAVLARLQDQPYGAFLSFTYNVGGGGFCKSTLARKLNAGDVRGACNELPKWVNARGIRLPGLVKRRAAEQKLCLQGAA